MTYREAVVQLADDAPDIPWAVTANATLAFRGLNEEPGAVRMTSTSEGVYAPEDSFSADIVPPARSPEETADQPSPSGHILELARQDRGGTNG